MGLSSHEYEYWRDKMMNDPDYEDIEDDDYDAVEDYANSWADLIYGQE